MRTAQIALTVAAAGILALSGCSSDDSSTAETTTTTATGTTTTASTETTTSTTASSTSAAPLTADAVIAAAGRLGLDCTPDEFATFCTDAAGANWQIRTSPAGDGDKAFVESACAAGAGSDGRVLTNGTTVVVYAGNDGQDLEAFNRQLTGEGVEGLEFVDYC